MDRRVTLDGVENFRDFGGYVTVDGRRLATGRLFRSGSHGKATDADLEVIGGLDIAVVVDLRRKNERERDPSRRPRRFAGQVIVNDVGEENEDSWLQHVTSSDLSEDSFHGYMFRYYAEAPFNPRLISLYADYFESLAKTDGAVLIHCAAGKDRTGILAALTHHLAGVAYDDMLADYLATNDPTRVERRLPMVMETIRDLTGRTPPEAAVRVAIGVEAAYLDTALQAMAERFGDVDGYLEGALGVDAARRAALRARLTE